MNSVGMHMEYHIKIEKIITGGKGLGYLKDGMAAMVPYVLPGEQVHIRQTKRFKGYIQAELVAVTHSSPFRQDPPCPWFTVCGGCGMQHIEYEQQLQIKRDIALESLERAGVRVTDITVHQTLASPSPYGYRSKIRLHCNRQGEIGFHRIASNTIVPITTCPLASSGIIKALQSLLHDERYKPAIAACREMEIIENPEDGEICLLAAPQLKRGNNLLPAFHGITPHVFPKTAPREAVDREAGMRLGQKFVLDAFSYHLHWDQNCFFQTNTLQNARMVNLVVDTLSRKHPKRIIDLFCGIGNFSIPLALTGSDVHGVEHNRHSTGWAETNAHLMRCKERCRFTAEDTARFLGTGKHRDADAIVLDPPRQGLGKENTRLLAQGNAGWIVYVSCDPATLSRDLVVLTGAGYRCTDIFPVDMFPQTHHIESVAVLEKN